MRGVSRTPARIRHRQPLHPRQTRRVDGKTTESELVTGETLYREPLTHWAENIGTTTVHLILVELK